MKKLVSILLTLAVAVSLFVVPAVVGAVDDSVTLTGGVYTNTLTLENKKGFGEAGAWSIVKDEIGGTLGYNTEGFEFVWGLEATVSTPGNYALIYYADKPDRFVEWGGDNPGKHIATVTANSEGVISASGNKDLNMDLPCPPDANQFENDYCVSDEYANCYGAKIWLVPTGDYDAPALTAWNPESYLFETDLIWYNDTDVESTIVAISVSPSDINFGILTPGAASTADPVRVTNTGNVPEDFSAQLVGISSLDVYSTGLRMDGEWAQNWKDSAIPAGFVEPELILTIPSTTVPGTYVATLVFWAEEEA